MTKNIRLTISTLCPVLLAMLLSACSSDRTEPAAPAIDDEGMAYLTITVSSGSSLGSRAEGDSTPTESDKTIFEETDIQYELMKTLRAIIIRPEGTIEHNQLLHKAPDNTGFDLYTAAYLKVIAGEKKSIYLFANEEYTNILNSDGKTLTEKLSELKPGDQFDSTEYSNLIITNSTGSSSGKIGPLVNNSDASKSYLPMCEQFDIKVKDVDAEGNNRYQSADLFVTRAAVKYGFYIDDNSDAKSNIKVTKITIHDIADREYMLPNTTTYAPAKYDTNGDITDDNRIITAYSCPDGVLTGDYTFNMPENFGVILDDEGNDGAVKEYEPAIYFAESPKPADSNFRITIETENDYFESITYKDIELSGLPYGLPRNTFVKVVLKLTDNELEVIVLPYIGVTLEPDFGIERP